jgi:hypothetical protein
MFSGPKKSMHRDYAVEKRIPGQRDRGKKMKYTKIRMQTHVAEILATNIQKE